MSINIKDDDTHRFSSPSDGLESCSLGMCSIHLNSIQRPIMRDWGKPRPQMHACHSTLSGGGEQSVEHDRIPSPGAGEGSPEGEGPLWGLCGEWLGVKLQDSGAVEKSAGVKGDRLWAVAGRAPQESGGRREAARENKENC